MNTPAAAVAREQSRARRLILLWGAALGVAGVAVVLGLSVFVFARGRWITLPAVLPFVVWASALGSLGLAAVLACRRITREITRAKVADAIEQERGLRRGALRGVLEVGEASALGRRAVEQVGRQLHGVSMLAVAMHQRLVRRVMAIGIVASVAVLTFYAAATAVPDGWRVMAHPVRAWHAPLPLPAYVVIGTVDTPFAGVVTLGPEHADSVRPITMAKPAHDSTYDTTHVLTIGEQRAMARQMADALVSQLAATDSAQHDLAQRTENAARARGLRPSRSSSNSGNASGTTRDNDALPYDAAQQAKALSQEQRQLAQRIDSLRQITQQLADQLRQAGALDDGLAAQLSEAQRNLNDALTPELKAQLDQLDQSANTLQNNATRQSLSDLAAAQQDLRNALDRTSEILKRAALEGSMQTLHDEAQDIAKAEHDSNASSNARAEQQLADRSHALSHDVDQLTKRLNAAQADTGAQQTANAQLSVDSSAKSMDHRDPTQAASQMNRAAQQLADARQSQVAAWKSAITKALDQSVRETTQLAQQEQNLSQQTQPADTLQAQQSAIQQGVNQTAQRIQRTARQSALISQGTQEAMGEAQASVQEATRALHDAQIGAAAGPGENGASPQTADALRDAAQALTDAAGAMANDRERAERASSSSGLEEMLQQMRQLAQRQGQLNAQSSGLMSGGTAAGARALADDERKIAGALEQMPSGEQAGGAIADAEALAREAGQIAAAIERSGMDPATVALQQQLYHRLLDAGHILEQDQRDSSAKRVSQAATEQNAFTPTNTSASGRAAMRYPEPSWTELRDLSADERRMVIDYFKRINATAP